MTASESSYAAGPTEPALLEETIGANLSRMCRADPDRDALVEVATGRRWTYRTFDEQVDRMASGLLQRGVGRGDRVGIWAPNCAEWTVVQYATARVGSILVTINPAYRARDLAYVLDQSECRMLISAASFKTSDYAAMIEAVRADAAALKDVVIIGSPDWDELWSSPIDPRLGELAGQLEVSDPINIQYTSGTTGFPKGATLSHRNILNNGYLVGEICGYTADDRICIPVPFYHCFGMVMGNLAATSHGACMVIPSTGFDPAATLRAVAAERCTSLYGVPTMWIAELGLPDYATYDLSSLRTGIMAGSPCPSSVMRQVIEDMGCAEITICYGMTETSPVSLHTRRDTPRELRVATVGTVHPHVEVKVTDPETGDLLPRGATGELCTCGYSVMLGYWNNPEQTAEAIDDRGWMHTGDLATMDADGYVAIVGRIKDMVIRGGENVYPREIEEFLHTHPAIADAQVVGVPDPKYGEELCAWVQLRPGAELEEAELRDFCRRGLSHYKVPRHLRFVDGFPMTVTGKVQKYKMRESSIVDLGLSS